ncbi:response regulator transcription factor [Pseudoxanthomonas sp. PXM02]|uniref:response regulator n=1 Tax=Pseudoxanthomonas sp. PXM02 TaxID=2769294 RepID=UPI00177FC246|nr:response regulator transcription factor [Pseudoxanthomonas sp. PXM02]MBD9478973.1 response regulator transcription factor [Pseudoxanthomonas sp. PXM02]
MDLHTYILVVDDDPELRTLIGDFLREHGYLVDVASDVAGMRDAIARRRPDLVVLDVMMPGEDGLSAARRLASEAGPPVIMLSALGTDTDRIIGLEVGADDYLAKPCNPRELLARVRALLRRQGSPAGDSGAAPATGEGAHYVFEGWNLDVVRRELRDPAGTYIHLSDGEFALLRTFVSHPQRVLSRDQLLDHGHGHDAEVYDRAIDSQVSRLRRKLNGRDGAEMIRTVRNEGYMLLPAVVRR